MYSTSVGVSCRSERQSKQSKLIVVETSHCLPCIASLLVSQMLMRWAATKLCLHNLIEDSGKGAERSIHASSIHAHFVKFRSDLRAARDVGRAFAGSIEVSAEPLCELCPRGTHHLGRTSP